MERYPVEQRVFIVKSYYKNGESLAQTVRKCNQEFGRNNVPSKTAIKNIIQKFNETGSVCDVKTPKRTRSGRSTENIAAVSASVEENPRTSIRHRSQQLNIPRSTLHNILRKDLNLRAYKIQLTQVLKPADHSQRRDFVSWALNQKANDAHFFNKIFFSEAHFHLGGYVNKQYCRIWGEENPLVIQEVPMHPERIKVWCGLWTGGVIGPYFFENDVGRAVTVNGERYRDMITNFLLPEIVDKNLENMWFQQDGATCHTARMTIDLLQTKFPQRVISRFGDVNWPPRSCDLTPLDYFLWGFVKGKVYANDPKTITELKNNIQRAIGEIEPALCQKVIENFHKRMVSCQMSRGGHLNDVVFHT